MPYDAAHLALIARGHRRLANAVTNELERRHWLTEAARFDVLTALAEVDEVKANAEYFPSRPYKSTA